MKTAYFRSLKGILADGAAIASSSTRTSLLVQSYDVSPGGGTSVVNTTPFPMMANTFDEIGDSFALEASGTMSTQASSPGTLTFEIGYGSPLSSFVIIASSGAINITGNITGATWYLRWKLTARAVGTVTTAKFRHAGIVIGSAFSSGAICIPATTPAVGNGFDSTATNNCMDLFATWSVGSASNIITCQQCDITPAR